MVFSSFRTPLTCLVGFQLEGMVRHDGEGRGRRQLAMLYQQSGSLAWLLRQDITIYTTHAGLELTVEPNQVSNPE